MKHVSFMDWFNGPIPQRRYQVQGLPLPKGMSPCIVGFYVRSTGPLCPVRVYRILRFSDYSRCDPDCYLCGK